MDPSQYIQVGMGATIVFLLVLLANVVRQQKTRRGWQQATMDRLESAMECLAAARYSARDGDWSEAIRLVAEAQEELQEICDYPNRYGELRKLDERK